jgi:uncharacterized protein YggE
MAETVISVQGSASAWHEAERATVSISVAHDGPKREPVFAATRESAATVTAILEDLHGREGGPVTRWSSDRIAVWSDRPWNSEGKQLPPVYHASIGITARFRDPEALAQFIEDLALSPGVTVSLVGWDLTEATRLAATTEVRTQAVADAIAKAEVYARAAGLSRVEVIAIADPGMLGDAGGSGGGAPFERMAFAAQGKAADAGGSPLAFTPDRIEVAAAVDARFRAG